MQSWSVCAVHGILLLFSRRLCRIDIAAIVAAGLVVLAWLSLSQAQVTASVSPPAPGTIVT